MTMEREYIDGLKARDHFICKCTGTLLGTEERCGKKRTHVQLNGRGDAHVCLNPLCNLYTRLPDITIAGGEYKILP